MNPTYEDYMKEVYEKMSPLLDAIGKKSTVEFLQFAESQSSEAKVAITLLDLAQKVKPANQEASDAVYFVLLCVLAQIALKNFKLAHQWADYGTKSFPNEETAWFSKFLCSQLEAVDWAVKAQNRNTWESGVMQSGWLGLAIGASSLKQKQRQFAEQIAYPSLMLAQMGLNKLKASDMDFEKFFGEVESITDQLEYTKDTRYWSQAASILNNLLAIDWNKFGDKADQDKIKKLKMKIQVVLASK
jgi:hypothetical protein